MTFNERLRQIREFRNLTQPELAKLIGVSQVAISNLERREKGKGGRFIIEIAKALNVDIEWLRNGTGESPFKEIQKKQIIDKWDDLKNINFKEIKGPFTLPVKGHAMEHPYDPGQSFRPSQKIIIDPTKTPFNGVFVVALLKNKESVIRKYIDEAGHKELQAFKAPPISFDEVDKIYGVITDKIENMLPAEA